MTAKLSFWISLTILGVSFVLEWLGARFNDAQFIGPWDEGLIMLIPVLMVADTICFNMYFRARYHLPFSFNKMITKGGYKGLRYAMWLTAGFIIKYLGLSVDFEQASLASSVVFTLIYYQEIESIRKNSFLNFNLLSILPEKIRPLMPSDSRLPAKQDLLCEVSLAGNFVKMVGPWKDYLGYGKDEMIGKPFMDFVHKDDKADTMTKFMDIGNGKLVKEFHNRYVSKDGKPVNFLWHAYTDTTGSFITGTVKVI